MPKKTTEPRDRKTTGTHKTGRASRVISDVLRTTCEELDRVGFAELSIEEVATRAGVNKTTIYRRWPTKSELVVSAIQEYYNQSQDFPDTGVLKTDLLEYVRLITRRAGSPMARGAMTTLNNGADPALKPLADELMGKARDFRTDIIQRAVDRGELPRHTDCALIAELFSAPILRKLLVFGETISPDYAETIIDIVITGAHAVAPPKKGKAGSRKIPSA